MKIGILTYHRAHNYGAILQAIATRTVLQSMGHQVYYIDYWPEYHKQKYHFFSFKKLRAQKFCYLISRIVLHKEIIKRSKMFFAEISKFIEPYCSLDKKYEAIVYGSDQIWRKQREINGYNSVYFADLSYSAPIRFSYAASMGIIRKSDSKEIKGLLKNFTAIGVREEDLLDFVTSFGYSAQLNLDPTMLLSSNEWDKILCPKRIISESYLLYYSLNKDVFNIDVINQYAKMRGLKVIEVCGEAKKEKNGVFPFASLSDFVSLIKYADVVISTSFHGLVFSILYHKMVFTSNRINAQRQRYLAKRLGLIDICLEPQCQVIPLDLLIDYSEVDKILEKERAVSMQFIKRNLC